VVERVVVLVWAVMSTLLRVAVDPGSGHHPTKGV